MIDFFISLCANNHYTVCLYSISCGGSSVRNELKEQVILERVELIARLTTEGTCHERDREIALDLIAELVKHNLMPFYSALSNHPLRD
jgi:hypothetical protein